MTDDTLTEWLYREADRRHGSVDSLRSKEWEIADRFNELLTALRTVCDELSAGGPGSYDKAHKAASEALGLN